MLRNQALINKFIISFGVFLTVIGLVFLTGNYFKEKISNSYNKMNLNILAYQEELAEQERIKKEEEARFKREEEERIRREEELRRQREAEARERNNYIGKLTIDKIGVDRGFYNTNSRYNSIDYGIQVHSSSTMPDVDKGNLILLSHSGNSSICIFKHLYKLTLDDTVKVTYKNKVYTYKIVNIYQVPKTGKISIERDMEKTTLTLITCTKDNKSTQTVYICELI